MVDRRGELASWIIDKVSQNWSSTRKALLLSRMGYEARQQFTDLSDIIPEGLKRFLVTIQDIQIVTHPTIPQMVGAAPVSERIDNPVSALTEGTGEQRVGRRPRFDQELWKAFYTTSPTRRFVVLPDHDHDTVSVVESETEIENGYEILSSDLVTTTFDMPLLEKVSAVENKIRAWAQRNGVDVNKLQESSPARSIKQLEVDRIGVFSKFESFAKLDQLDQARIMIPLDIVIKLLERRK